MKDKREKMISVKIVKGITDDNIKNLSSNLKGFKERFKNPNNDISEVAALFRTCIYEAYVIDDIALNYKVVVAARQVERVLRERMSFTKSAEEFYELEQNLFEIEAIMNPFYRQAGKKYE